MHTRVVVLIVEPALTDSAIVILIGELVNLFNFASASIIIMHMLPMNTN